jgi:hypothetical protein
MSIQPNIMALCFAFFSKKIDQQFYGLGVKTVFGFFDAKKLRLIRESECVAIR